MIRVFILLCALLVPSLTHAVEPDVTTRMRFTVHKEHEFRHGTELHVKLILADDVLANHSPIAAAGIKQHLATWLSAELLAGWATAHNEPLIEIALLPHGSTLWGTMTVEWRVLSQHGYWFTQAEYKLHDTWLHAGWENEVWGSLLEHESLNIKTGPNLILRFKRMETDLAFHLRDINKNTNPEIVVRVHVNL